MSNSLYDSARQNFADGQINFSGDNIKVALVAGTYQGGPLALSNHSTFSDIATHVLAGVKPIKTLTAKTSALNGKKGVVAAEPTVFDSISANQVVSYIVVFKDPAGTVDGAPASPANAPLIALFDSGYGVGAGTNGGNIKITWDATNGIFKL